MFKNVELMSDEELKIYEKYISDLSEQCNLHFNYVLLVRHSRQNRQRGDIESAERNDRIASLYKSDFDTKFVEV